VVGWRYKEGGWGIRKARGRGKREEGKGLENLG
jgi:hypothetical protein